MRPVDADAILKEMGEEPEVWFNDGYSLGLSDQYKCDVDIIKAAPTVKPVFGRWKQIPAGMTPGGTPMFACAYCGGTEHLHGAEYPKKKLTCDVCGSVNTYPWENVII